GQFFGYSADSVRSIESLAGRKRRGPPSEQQQDRGGLRCQRVFRNTMGAAIEHVYHYDGPTRREPGTLRLASSPGRGQAPFLDARLVWPRQIADLLLTLSEVVRSRFSIPPAMLRRILAAADPVITCHHAGGPVARFEGFSACCGVYARVD